MTEEFSIEAKIRGLIEKALKDVKFLPLEAGSTQAAQLSQITLEFPADLAHGDYSSNVALTLAKQLKKNPRELAVEIVAAIQKEVAANTILEIEKIEVAGAGFINFYLSKQFFAEEIEHILKSAGKSGAKSYGANDSQKGKKILIEYTDPNPFKAFHIGHLMSNAIGESLSRLLEATGAKVKRANYQGDVGLHVAKAIYGMQMMKTEMPVSKSDKTTISHFLGNAYATGAKLYEKDEQTKAKIQQINKQVYVIVAGDKSDDKGADKEIKKLYDIGRKWSLEHFEDIYETLGTHFDYYFFESEVAEEGSQIVKMHLGNGNGSADANTDAKPAVFEKSDGAIVFKGERFGLHTRVFITKEGIPTYEAKELGLNKRKFDKVSPDLSITVTAEEQREYFRVVMKAIEQIAPDIAAKMKHTAHGMLVLPSGKMSSRTGDVITGESLIADTIARVREKMSTAEEQKAIADAKVAAKVAEQVAVGAIKYMLLRQSPGKNIVYDMEKSLSLEGDSGPYLQYAVVRAKSVLEKAAKMKIKASTKISLVKMVPKSTLNELQRMLIRFPHIVAHAQEIYAPSDVATYLIQLAGAFNAFYANEQIASSDSSEAPYNVALTTAFAQVMQNGLCLLGIETPKRM